MTETAGQTPLVGVLGGTGPQGRGLAFRLATAGAPVLLGSRDATRAAEAAAELGLGIEGDDNRGCAARADIVLVVVPYEGHGELLASLRDELAGKVVVDCVNPLGFDKRGAFRLDVAAGSAAEEAQQILPDSMVVGAFHHLSAVLLIDPEVPTIDSDVMVVGDDREATDRVQALADLIPGVRGVYSGPLRSAGQVEALTANLISANRRYKTHAGVRITGV